MIQVWNWLQGKKTYIVSGVVVVLYGLQHAGITIPGVVEITPTMLETAILGGTIRHGIAGDASSDLAQRGGPSIPAPK